MNLSLDNSNKEVEIEKENDDKFRELKQLYTILHSNISETKDTMKITASSKNKKLLHSSECIKILLNGISHSNDNKLLKELYYTIQYFLYKDKMLNRKEFFYNVYKAVCYNVEIKDNKCVVIDDIECSEEENEDKYSHLYKWDNWQYKYDECIMKYDFIKMSKKDIINSMIENDKEIMKEINEKKLLHHLCFRIYCLSRLNQSIVYTSSNNILNICKIPFIEEIKCYLTTSTIQSIIVYYYSCFSKLSLVTVLLNDSLKVKDNSLCNCIYHQFLNNIWNLENSKRSSLSHSLSLINQSYQQISITYLLFVAMNHKYLFSNRNGKFMININGNSIYLNKEYYGIGIIIGLIIESVNFDVFKYFPVYFWKLLFNDCLSVEDIDIDILTNSMNESSTSIFKSYADQLISKSDFDSYHFCYNVSMKYIRKGLLDVIPYDIYKLLSYRFIQSLQNM